MHIVGDSIVAHYIYTLYLFRTQNQVCCIYSRATSKIYFESLSGQYFIKSFTTNSECRRISHKRRHTNMVFSSLIDYILTTFLPDECLIKVMLLGDSATGKTVVLNQLFKGEPFEKAS